jgi:hypothetical protein
LPTHELTEQQRAAFLIPGTDGVDLWATWITDPTTGDTIGLHAHHPYVEINDGRWPECNGGGYIAWVEVKGITPVARHQLVAGGPGDVEALTITPSLWHRAPSRGDSHSPHRGCHGFITAGRWEVV